IGVDITGVHVQNRATMDPRSYAGSGFLNEIDLQYEKGSLDYVIVNDEITASQNRAVEEVMDTRIIDRTQVILVTFRLRAHSTARQLQVDNAQNQYHIPQMRGQEISLRRLGVGIGTRGPG